MFLLLYGLDLSHFSFLLVDQCSTDLLGPAEVDCVVFDEPRDRFSAIVDLR